MSVATLRTWQRIQAVLWILLGAAAVASSAVAAHLLPITATLAGVSFATLFVVCGAGRVADWCTAARALAMVIAVAMASAAPSPTWPVFALCAAALAADLLDGAIARRAGPTAHGAVLDMETDQLATLQLAVLAVARGGVGPWALLLPAYRYAFVLLSWWRDLPAHDPKPKAGNNQRARVICAVTMVLQLVAIAPAVGADARATCLAVAIAALAYSYGDDVSYLLRRARATQ